MKRIGNLYPKIYAIDNLMIADKKASRGKSKQPGVIWHNKHKEQNILKLHDALKNKTYHTSEYSVFKIYEPKVREIYRLPYYPDRITHHAIMNVLEPIFMSTFTADTYSCIKGRGIHKAYDKMRVALKDKENTKYCLKFDIQKFFPSVDHDILKGLLRRKFKDNNLLWLLDEIIDSTFGLPIGNFASQHFGNFYLTYFDHWIKEKKKVKYYARYCDDMVILHNDKVYLHNLLNEAREYLSVNLKLTIKGNHQVFPIASRGLDFVGYKTYHTHSLLRKSIKKRFVRMIYKNYNDKSIVSYYGWIKHCNGINLLETYLN